MKHSRKVFLAVSLLVTIALSLAIYASRDAKANDTAHTKTNLTPNLAANSLPITIKYERGSDIGKLYVLLAMSGGSARKAAYSQFTADEKSRIWQLHLTLYRLNSQLTPSQDAIYAEALELARLINYDDLTASIQHTSRVKAVYEKAVATFGLTKARAIFDDLGGALTLTPQGTIPKAGFFTDCGCSTYWNWCGDDTCRSGADGCTTTAHGCGPLWGWPCDGLCKPKIID